MKPDTYFFSAKEALKVAKEQNRSDDILQYNLQVCYYDGEEIQTDLVNLIHSPIDSMIDDLALGTYRIPVEVDYTGMDVSQDVLTDIKENISISLELAKHARGELNKLYIQKLKTAKLDFSEPLRIYIEAHSRTRVMQYHSRDIANSFIDRGYDVFFTYN
jgi:hypothetical protein